ncbi:MAG: sugar kinase, partial [Mycobacterium sp.]
MTAPAVTFGETMGLFAADTVGHLSHLPSLSVGIGGAESNVAIAMARLDVPVVWMGRVGHDPLGDKVIREIRAEGVIVRAVRDPDRSTGLMIKERPPGGGVNVWYYRAGGAGSALCVDDIDDTAIAGASVLHVTGITPSLGPAPRAATYHAIDVARAHGVPVSFDVNYRATLWPPDIARPVLSDLARSADLLFAGADEARLVLGAKYEDCTDATELSKALSALGPAEVVVKLGDEGALALLDG